MTTTSRFCQLVRAMLVIMTLSHAVSGWAKNRGSDDEAAQAPLEKTLTAPIPLDGILPLDELRTLVEIVELFKLHHVTKVPDKIILERFMKNIGDHFDPHSEYYSEDDFKELQVSTSGEFGGLGVDISMEDGYVKVIAPIDDTPAYKAGIQAGDLIIKLGDTPVKGLTLRQSIEKMRGKAGDPIKLTIVRDGEAKPLTLVVKRDIIKVQSVKTRTLDDGYGYIRISQFQSDTDKELLKGLTQLKQTQKDHQLKGLVLDLRNNPGGVLQSAVGVADAFLKEGLIVYTQGRSSSSELRFNATTTDPSEGLPLVVLINGGSASASEIVAGALQDHHRGVVMGSTSFGKGSVQTVFPIGVDAKRGLKLTTALYYTPSGRSIQATGIKPDITLQSAKVTLLDASLRYKEADLKGHLNNGSSSEESSKKDVAKKTENDSKDKFKSLLEEDYQLSQALNVVKGMHLISLIEKPSKHIDKNN